MSKLIKHPWLLAIVLSVNLVGLVYQSVAIRASSPMAAPAAARVAETILEPAPVAPVFDFSRPADFGGEVNIPIVTFHKTPANFESQLRHLSDRGYSTITMDQAAAAIGYGQALPSKPVVLTFDDGFADQMRAFELLQKYQMRATYYIITGGAASQWCIGVDRRYDQGYGCGDAYLSWGQVRQLDQSGLIEIAAHTVNHLALAAQPFEVQLREILEAKSTLEAQIGHQVRHTAYPYGSYNSGAIEAVKQAGFVSAVTTQPGTMHTAAGLLSLRRVTNVFALP